MNTGNEDPTQLDTRDDKDLCECRQGNVRRCKDVSPDGCGKNMPDIVDQLTEENWHGAAYYVQSLRTLADKEPAP